MITLTNKDVQTLTTKMFVRIAAYMDHNRLSEIKIWGVPRGGIPVSYLLSGISFNFIIVDDINEANVIVDDIIDSGATRDRYKNYNKLFIALIDKTNGEYHNEWVQFPWEVTDSESTYQDIVLRIKQYLDGNCPDKEQFIEAVKELI